MINDVLGDRMKEYESRNQYFLQRRTPVIIRVDGKAFHTFTRGFQKPFDEALGNAMVRTMEYLCQNINGCIFGYVQSDEITLVLQDYRKLNTDAWFGYRTDKLCSITASMATMAFNRFFRDEVEDYCVNEYINCCGFEDVKRVYSLEELKTVDPVLYAYNTAMGKGAMFDARCFNIPKEEVCNCIYWRQLDATRNSIQMVGQANFSHAELQEKSCNEIQDMLHEQRGINWNDFPTRWKRGVAWTKTNGTDYEMPILRGENRKYVDDEVWFVEEE
jgi:tRNA(His) 5'-end guanylyltransferase